MEHKSMLNFPPRIGSAPLSQSQQTFQRVSSRNPPASFRAAPVRPNNNINNNNINNNNNNEKQSTTLPQNHHHHNFMQTSQQTESQASPSPSTGIMDRGSSSLGGDSSTSSYPANCIYDITEFVKLQNTRDTPPSGILDFVNELWKDMPENKDSKPEHILSRDNLFQGESMPSKVMSERRLHNEVLGILGKVSEDNLDKMKKELTDLPIRQSSGEEIEQVIRVFFNKSIRPEDSIFVPLYVKLISHLISDIGENEQAGKYIRNAIIRQCQDTFENAGDAQGQLEREVATLSPDEAELRRLVFVGKQKANINFLGLLFIHGLVREKVVLQILEGLLYGAERKRRIPTDYELTHFMDLLKTCGKYFSKEGQEFIPNFREVLVGLMNTHPQRRMQFLLLNTVETIDNNWVPPFGAKSNTNNNNTNNNNNNNTYSSQENDGERRVIQPATPRNNASPPPAMKPIPPRDLFWGAMDKYFLTSSAEEAVILLTDIPEDTRVAYCSSVINRYITTVRYSQQRARLGDLFEELSNKGVLPIKDVRKALFIHLREAVAQDLFTDIPKYFLHWAVVIKGGRDVFPLSLHNDFLNILIEEGVSCENIVKMVRDVHIVLNETPNPPAETDLKTRFRVLPALLRYTPRLLAGDAQEDSEDILKQVSKFDADVNYFCNLCEETDSREIFMITTEQLKSAHQAFSLISAFFTFARFDVENLCREFKESVKKMISSKQLHLLLEDVYVTFLALDRTPENSFVLFVKALRGLGGAKEQIDKFKVLLNKSYGAVGKKDAEALDKIKDTNSKN